MSSEMSSTGSRFSVLFKRELVYHTVYGIAGVFMQMNVAVHEHINVEFEGFINGHCIQLCIFLCLWVDVMNKCSTCLTQVF